MKRILVLILGCAAASAAELPSASDLAARGAAWLLAQQREDGSFSEQPFALGITELALGALLAPPRSLAVDDARVQRGIAFIRRHIQEDGGIYLPREGLGVYGTGLGVLALRAAGALDEDTAARARRFMLGLQNLDPGSSGYGGVGYDPHDGAGSEDLHNASTAVEALRAAGLPASDPRMQAVLHFVSLCQDLSPPPGADPPRLDGLPQPPTAVHTQRQWTTGSGGGARRPALSLQPRTVAGGHEDESGRKPSAYGTMTYALVATYISLDLSPRDPRVQAAMGWIARNWTLDANPGMPAGRGQDGLYYGYAIMARALDLAGVGTLELADGRRVDWRGELSAALAARAHADGDGRSRWVNSSRRWGEGLPGLSTSYALSALKLALPR